MLLEHDAGSVVLRPKRKSSSKQVSGIEKRSNAVDLTLTVPMTCSQTSACNLKGTVDAPVESKADKIISNLIDLTMGNDVTVARSEPPTAWPEFRYYQTDEQWQRGKCRQLNLVFARANKFQPGGPTVILKHPDLKTVVKGIGDGNCLFRCFSYILTGSQDQHLAIRMAIVAHMRSIAQLFEVCLQLNVMNYASLDHYIASSHMDRPNSEGRYGWGSETEMYAFAHMMKCNIYSYDPTSKFWMPVMPNILDSALPNDVCQMSMYIVWTNNNHFDIITSQSQ